MMEFFIYLMIFFLVMSAVQSMAEVKNLHPNLKPSKEKTCPPHKWVYKTQPGDDTEYLVCDVCKILPGSNLREEV